MRRTIKSGRRPLDGNRAAAKLELNPASGRPRSAGFFFARAPDRKSRAASVDGSKLEFDCLHCGQAGGFDAVENQANVHTGLDRGLPGGRNLFKIGSRQNTWPSSRVRVKPANARPESSRPLIATALMITGERTDEPTHEERGRATQGFPDLPWRGYGRCRDVGGSSTPNSGRGIERNGSR